MGIGVVKSRSAVQKSKHWNSSSTQEGQSLGIPVLNEDVGFSDR